MNELLEKAAFKDITFNDYIKHGFARYDMKDPMGFLDAIIRSIIKNQKKNPEAFSGLDYIGYKTLLPTEEVESNTNNASNQKTQFDVTISDVKKYLLNFRYGSEDIYKPLYLPAVQKDSSFRISGTKFLLVPVLTDPIISANPNGSGLFTKFFRDKLNIRSRGYICKINGMKSVRDFVFIEKFYKLNRLDSLYDTNLVNLETPVIMYLLAKYGISGTLEKYTNKMYGDEFIILKKDERDIEGYDIVESLNIQNPDIKGVYTDRHHLRIAIKKNSSRLLYNMAYGLLYVFDAMPKRALELVKSIGTTRERSYWVVLTGEITFKGAYTYDRIIEALTDHMDKIESYIDPIVQDEFKEIGMYVEDIYDFIVNVVEKYKDYITIAKSFSNTVKNKHLEVLYYVMFNIISDVNKNLDEIQKQHRRGSLNPRNMQFILKKAFSPRKIFNIAKASSQILPLTIYNTVMDNRIPKLNVMLELQERGSGVTRGNSSTSSKFPMSVRKLTATDLIVGNMWYLVKHCPTPRVRLNPQAKFDEHNRPLISKDIEKVVRLIDRKLNNRRQDIDSLEIELETIDLI